MDKKLSKYQFLQADHLESLGSVVTPLDGPFVLLPPKFQPRTDLDPLSDGEPPTDTGLAAMEFWAAAHGVDDPYECPTGIVRSIEAVSATSANAGAIRAAMPSNRIRWSRNQAGGIASFTIEVLVPMVGPATVQPRGITAATQRLRDVHGQTTIHEIGEGLTITGLSGSHLVNIRDVQREVLDPASYAGDQRRDFVDSLATQGILEPLRGFTFRLITPEGSAWAVENDDGTTRTSTAQEFLSILAGGLPADLSRMHWDNGDNTVSPRDWSPDKIRDAYRAMRFEASNIEVWPPVESAKEVARWAEDASPLQQAIIRLMTAQMTIGVAVQPHAGNTTSMVVWSDMARYHDKAHQPTPWAAADNEAFKARTIVSDLASAGHITAGQRAVMLGEVQVPWRYQSGASPYTSRLEAILDTMVQCVIEDPAYPDRYPQVRETLKRMRVPSSPASAATAASSLAASVAGLTGTGEVGAYTAMLRRSYKNAVVRRVVKHSGDEGWPIWMGQPLADVLNAAEEELDAVIGTEALRNDPGPAQRALALMAMAAHGANPRLIDYSEEADGKTVRRPSSMTINGRGGRVRGKGAASDAHVIVFNMSRSPRGLRQLEAIVSAVLDHDRPILPVDPSDGEPLIEDTLRRTWAQTPELDGTARPIIEGSGQGHDRDGSDGEDEETSDPWELSTQAGWAAMASEFRDELRVMANKARTLSDVPAGWEVLGINEEEWDPDDDTTERMLQIEGVDNDTADGHQDDVVEVQRFFSDGHLAWLRRKAGL